MGNKTARKPKVGSQSSMGGLKQINTNSSTKPVLPPAKTGYHKRGVQGSFNSISSMGSPSGVSQGQEGGLTKGIDGLTLADGYPVQQRPGLRFKSFRTGTLITKNGEPTVLPPTGPLPPHPRAIQRTLSPLPPPPTISRLSAASPSFVPSTPSPDSTPKATANPIDTGLPISQTPSLQKVRNLLQVIRASPNHGYSLYHGGNGRHNDGYNNYSHEQSRGHAYSQNYRQGQCEQDVGNYPAQPDGMAMSHSPEPSQTLVHYPAAPKPRLQAGSALAVQSPRHIESQRPSREFTARKDKGKKDIIITASGVTRNAVRIIEKHLPNGFPFQTMKNDFDSGKYDLISDFQSMNAKAKKDFLGRSFVDIQVHLKNTEEEREEEEKKKGTGRDDEVKAKKGRGKGKAKKLAVETEPSAQVAPREVTVIDTLKALGDDFAANTKRLTITLIFPTLPIPADAPIMTGGGPVSQLTVTPPTGPAQTSPNFLFLAKLVDHLHGMSNLSQVTINLVVPSQSRMPLSMPQLFHVLPFYDMGFTEWDISYQPDNLSVPLKVHGWAVGQLDRERDKIIRERLRKVEEAVFVRGSVMPGYANLPISNTASPVYGSR